MIFIPPLFLSASFVINQTFLPSLQNATPHEPLSAPLPPPLLAVLACPAVTPLSVVSIYVFVICIIGWAIRCSGFVSVPCFVVRASYQRSAAQLFHLLYAAFLFGTILCFELLGTNVSDSDQQLRSLDTVYQSILCFITFKILWGMCVAEVWIIVIGKLVFG